MRNIQRAWAFAAAFALLGSTGGAAAAQSNAPAIDAAWLSADSAAKTATFTLTAGLTPANSGLNFNGFKNGELMLTVPKNWTLVIRFVNNDPNLPHSATVIPDTKSPPLGAVPPAFRRAFTKNLDAGFLRGGHDEFSFVANKAGSYLIFCAVPGHGAAGMWIQLRVSDAVRQASLAAS